MISYFKLYSRVNLSVADQTLPSFEGFWTQDIDIPADQNEQEKPSTESFTTNIHFRKNSYTSQTVLYK
jgi:hypothetical protein